MRPVSKRATAIAKALTLAILLGGFPFFTNASLAGSTGTLKLKVRDCRTATSWLSNALVEVTLYRPGVGDLTSTSDYTDGSGYVEFTFYDLEDQDEAHVTVTPSGGSSDDNHTYSWSESGGRDTPHWDISDSDSGCSDSFYDEEKNIIECVHQ